MSTAPIRPPEMEADPAFAMRLIEISAGFWLPRVLHVVADLGVADALSDQPQTAEYLAAKVNANADALDRVLRLLASHGIFERTGGTYAHNQLSRALRSDHPQSLRSYVRLLGLPIFWQSWGDLGKAVRNGGPAADDIFRYFKDHPQESEIFHGAMEAKAQTAIGPVIAAYDFSGFGSVGDIGGGHGHLLRAILKSAPKSRGVLFDQPHVVANAKADGPVGDRMVLQGGDFFRGPLPSCDAYLLMEVLHDWNNEDSVRILQQIRKSAADNAKVLVVETVLPDQAAWAAGKGAHFAHHLDINMLVLTGGRERTPEEFTRLFAASGWRFSRVIPTASPYSIVEGVAS